MNTQEVKAAENGAPITVNDAPTREASLLAALAPRIYLLTGTRAKRTTAPAVDVRISLPPTTAWQGEGARTKDVPPVTVLSAQETGGRLSGTSRMLAARPQVLIHPNICTDPYLVGEALYLSALGVYAPPENSTSKSGSTTIRKKSARYNEVAAALDITTKGTPLPRIGTLAKSAVAGIVDAFLAETPDGANRWAADMEAFALFKTLEEVKPAFEDSIVCTSDLTGNSGKARKRDERHVSFKTPKGRTDKVLSSWKCYVCRKALVVLPVKAKAVTAPLSEVADAALDMDATES